MFVAVVGSVHFVKNSFAAVDAANAHLNKKNVVTYYRRFSTSTVILFLTGYSKRGKLFNPTAAAAEADIINNF